MVSGDQDSYSRCLTLISSLIHLQVSLNDYFFGPKNRKNRRQDRLERIVRLENLRSQAKGNMPSDRHSVVADVVKWSFLTIWMQ